MNCPFKMANPELAGHWSPNEARFIGADQVCEKAACQLWNERFGKCALAVDAYLKGQEDLLKERGMKQ